MTPEAQRRIGIIMTETQEQDNVGLVKLFLGSTSATLQPTHKYKSQTTKVFYGSAHRGDTTYNYVPMFV